MAYSTVRVRGWSKLILNNTMNQSNSIPTHALDRLHEAGAQAGATLRNLLLRMGTDEFWNVTDMDTAEKLMNIMANHPYMRNAYAPAQKPEWRTRIHGQMLSRIARSHMSAAMTREMNSDPAYRRFTRNKKSSTEEGD